MPAMSATLRLPEHCWTSSNSWQDGHLACRIAGSVISRTAWLQLTSGSGTYNILTDRSFDNPLGKDKPAVSRWPDGTTSYRATVSIFLPAIVRGGRIYVEARPESILEGRRNELKQSGRGRVATAGFADTCSYGGSSKNLPLRGQSSTVAQVDHEGARSGRYPKPSRTKCEEAGSSRYRDGWPVVVNCRTTVSGNGCRRSSGGQGLGHWTLDCYRTPPLIVQGKPLLVGTTFATPTPVRRRYPFVLIGWLEHRSSVGLLTMCQRQRRQPETRSLASILSRPAITNG
jgi:hypothetical protein